MIDFVWDENRQERTGIAEVVFCSGKTAKQINAILAYHIEKNQPTLLTRLSLPIYEQIIEELRLLIDYDADAEIGSFNQQANDGSSKNKVKTGIAIVTAGTSDLKVATEARRTLEFSGFDAPVIADVGVAGISRLLARIEELNRYQLLIAVAGMEGALFSVLAGLVRAPVIAVPTSVGYGVALGGKAALSSALASCAPGVVTVNIDNGFGAAVAAIKMYSAFARGVV